MRSIIIALVLCCSLPAVAQQLSSDSLYQCKPCGRDCDNKVFASGGHCIDCHMELVLKKDVVQQNLGAAELCSFIKANPRALVLDVRTEEEYKNLDQRKLGTVKKAMNIPIGELPGRLAKITKYKGRPVVVYCSHGHRSAEASYLLQTG